MCERSIYQVPPARPQPGARPATQALIGNRTGDLSVCRKMPNPLSHVCQGGEIFESVCFAGIYDLGGETKIHGSSNYMKI